ncbi:hypothetical protein NXX23_20915 [Bacteroides ovatus]|nr:hypothetical protein [Bacteroides ovatus]
MTKTNGVDSEGEKAKARATEAESWDFVLKDLEFAQTPSERMGQQMGWAFD